jgi:hypothetical protein
MAAAAVKLVHVDLEAVFNRDVIADPGDGENDTFDSPGGGLLIAGGFDGSRPDSASARGLPQDGRVGVHRLGGARGRNSLALTAADREPVTLRLDPGRYAALRFLVSGGEGASRLMVSLRYRGGRSESHAIPCPDWFDDPGPAIAGEGEDPFITEAGIPATPIRNGMDRIYKGKFHDANDAALFEVILPADAQSELLSVELEPARSWFANGRSTFHLLGLAAAPASE